MAEHEASPGISSAPLHWRVRVCRLLWRVLRFVWGTLILGVVTATIATIATATTDTPLAKLNIVHLAQSYPLPVWASLGLLAALTLLSWLGSREKQATATGTLSERDRMYMLRHLRFRYEQLLSQSLQGAVQLELGLAQKPAAVQNELSLARRVPDQPEQALPPHTSIVQAFELAQQDLLILGEPGAGKSTLLLELARSLVEQDTAPLLPVMLPLSSWAERKRPLNEWLAEEIARLYRVPRRLSQQWIQAEEVLPLLDGLDEMDEAARPACVAAINTYHHEHLRPLVVCSRTSEYEAAAKHERLMLHTAVIVQPLEPGRVDAYLASLGRPLAGLRAALKTNPLLQELVTTPLLLQVLMLTYRGTSVRMLFQKQAQLREQIWTDYVQRMVREKGDSGRYPLAIITGWLGWLASEMREHNQTIFSLETLPPIWLPLRQRNPYRWSVAMGIGLVFGLVFGLVGGLIGGLVFGLVGGLFGGLPSGLFTWLVFGLVFMLSNGEMDDIINAELQPAEIITWSWGNFRSTSLAFGLVGGLVVGLPIGLAIGLLKGLLFGLVVGLLFGMFLGFSGEQLTERLMLSPNEGIHRSLKNGLTFGLISGLLFGLAFGLFFGLFFGLVFGLIFGLFFGVAFFGLGVAVQHYLLRFWLARSGVFPWRAVPFLEDATARILLRRVGGGYSFTHRLLLDFFADAYIAASAQQALRKQGFFGPILPALAFYGGLAVQIADFTALAITLSGGSDAWAAPIFLCGILLAVILIIICMVSIVRQKRWGWCVGLLLGSISGAAVIILPGLTLILFGLFAPRTPPVAPTPPAQTSDPEALQKTKE